jgi:hypothetical protein
MTQYTDDDGDSVEDGNGGTADLIRRLRNAAGVVRGVNHHGQDALMFLNTRYESFPVSLQQDAMISSNAKVIYNHLLIWAKDQRAHTDASLFPDYDWLIRATNLGRGTIASGLAQLRLQRYLTLHQRLRSEGGRFVGNDWILNDEPMAASDTLILDPNFIEFINECKNHRHNRIQGLAIAASKMMERHIATADDPFRPVTQMEKIEMRQQAAMIQHQRLFPDKVIPGQQPAPEHYYGIPVDLFNEFVDRFRGKEKVNAVVNSVVNTVVNVDDENQVHKVNAVDFSQVHKVNSVNSPENSQVHKVNSVKTSQNTQVHKVNSAVNSSSSSFIYKSTTTETPEFTISDNIHQSLFYPEFSTSNELELCKMHIAKLPPEHRQPILDELSARMVSKDKKPLGNPIAYLKGWLIKHLNEGEIPYTSAGARVAADRDKAKGSTVNNEERLNLKAEIKHLERMVQIITQQGGDVSELVEQLEGKKAELAKLDDAMQPNNSINLANTT